MIIWLASYPKSGNTWVRSIISSLVYTKEGIFNFDLLRKIQNGDYDLITAIDGYRFHIFLVS